MACIIRARPTILQHLKAALPAPPSLLSSRCRERSHIRSQVGVGAPSFLQPPAWVHPSDPCAPAHRMSGTHMLIPRFDHSACAWIVPPAPGCKAHPGRTTQSRNNVVLSRYPRRSSTVRMRAFLCGLLFLSDKLAWCYGVRSDIAGPSPQPVPCGQGVDLA